MTVPAGLLTDLQAALVSAEARVAELERERDEWHEIADNRYDAEILHAAEADAREVRARVAELEAALQRVLEEWDAPVEGASETELQDRMEQARAALAAAPSVTADTEEPA